MKLTILTTKELRSKKPAEIDAYIAQLQNDQIELNHARFTGKETKTHQVAIIKKAIARAYTVKAQANAGEEK